MDCGTTLVKYLLFAFNFVFVLGGLALIVLGALTYAAIGQYDALISEFGFAFHGPPIGMMVVGSIVFLIAFMGCCGAIRESSIMMSTYGGILALLLLLQVGAIIVAAIHMDDVDKAVKDGFMESMSLYGGDTDEGRDVTVAWDNMQEGFKCCGTTSYLDWNAVNKNVPASCCRVGTDNCPAAGIPSPGPLIVFTEGCYTKVVSEIGIAWLVGAAAVVGAVELLGIVLGCCLAGRYRKRN